MIRKCYPFRSLCLCGSIFCSLYSDYFVPQIAMVCNGKPLFLAVLQTAFHYCCLACSVIGVDSIPFMQKLYAASLCSMDGWMQNVW